MSSERAARVWEVLLDAATFFLTSAYQHWRLRKEVDRNRKPYALQVFAWPQVCFEGILSGERTVQT